MVVTPLVLRALLLVGFVLCSGLAAAQAESPTLVVDVLPGAAELDAATVRQGVASELARRVIAPGEPGARSAEGKFTIGVDREKNEVVIEFHRGGGSSLTRRLPLLIDRSKLQQNLVFLVGNMARDESREVLRDLRHDAVVPATPAATHEVLPAEEPSAPRLAPTPRRFWIGVDAEAALGVVPSESNVCGPEPTTSGFHCVMQNGQDYAPTVVAGQDASQEWGMIRSGVAFASSRYTVSFDHVVHDHWLVGGRLGFAVGRYPGHAAGLEGKTWGPTHVEVRATYVLGEQALVQPGFRPALTAGAGVAGWDTRTTVRVTAGDPPVPVIVDAWRVQAGFFLSLAVGTRIMLGERTAILINVIKFTTLFGAISGTGATLLFTPEVGARVAF